jgi:hypothetical protein
MIRCIRLLRQGKTQGPHFPHQSRAQSKGDIDESCLPPNSIDDHSSRNGCRDNSCVGSSPGSCLHGRAAATLQRRRHEVMQCGCARRRSDHDVHAEAICRAEQGLQVGLQDRKIGSRRQRKEVGPVTSFRPNGGGRRPARCLYQSQFNRVDGSGTGMGGRIGDRDVQVAGRNLLAAVARDRPLCLLSTDSR